MGFMYVNFVLHAHLPYVRHREANRLEERWLYEAMTECYIPLLWQLEKDDHLQKWTISFSPPLMEMLADPLVQRRYLLYLEQTESLLRKEKELATSLEEQSVVSFYEARYEKIRTTFLKWNQNILEGFKYHYNGGKIECITSSATHTFLPYLQTKQGVHMQVKHGITCFEKHFGKRPNGMWLPECAYTPGIDAILHREGIRFAFVDEHAMNFADPTPSKGAGAPVYSPHGVALFARNHDISNRIWSSSYGYPGDHHYREFYRDIAYDRDWDYIAPYVHPDGIRIDTGIKMHRITGNTEYKEIYNHEVARQKVKEHANHFASVLQEHRTKYGDQSFPPHIVTLPFDAELFGHWWFEGPEFFHEVISNQLDDIEYITPTDYINRHYRDLETSHFTFSTWGREGYGDVWLNEKNEWMYRHLHTMETNLVEAVSSMDLSQPLIVMAMKQLCREWMLATSSDWAFIVDNESASQYATNRCKEHIKRFHTIMKELEHGRLSEQFINSLEADYPFMKEIDLSILQSPHDEFVKNEQTPSAAKKVLLLSWEFPPRMIGGLARHVYELSKSLVQLGQEVYVITAKEGDSPEYELVDGIHVYRVKGYQPHSEDFLHWIGGLNLSMVERVLELSKRINFDVIHAHDWLVESSAITLKKALNIPLVATIHATEHGRNGGIHTPLQTAISEKERLLIQKADTIIVCSDYMKQEVSSIEREALAKIEVIPNGVDRSFFTEKPVEGKNYIWENFIHDQLVVFSMGRLVPEKGFQTIIDAAPQIIDKVPNVTFIIAGTGPLEKRYHDEIVEKNLQDYVHMIGFVEDDERNALLRTCDVSVFPSLYEPFGIAALEAMIAKKPVVVSRTGGLISFVKNGVTGISVTPGSSEELTKAIHVLLTNKKLSEKLAENGQKTAYLQYNWDRIGERTVTQYQNLIGIYETV
ncbi:1,4-alpha-glucan branching protein domain-containing protein [Bacillus suaedaesalsae]|uniref:DUF1957 domain-containing protein n=1 Tax=Bacillus suaedaesalsae TaxID=2810349 RepID=A0ABS2DGU1_9BACI|nr:1,4-alpha-glucan branching protein domain-containing protein [Bacillus suaedaesalsae]MBM6617250.1 DUF1957 domain-containing protein [Bacillus suaedaesalsae]